MDCPICLDICVNPQVGTCGHSVCGPCASEMPSPKCCPQCRKQTTFSVNFALRDLIQAQYPKAYAEREHKCDVSSSLEEFLDDMRKEWPGTELRYSKFDDEHTLDILRAIRRDLKNEAKFYSAFGNKVSCLKCRHDKHVQYRLRSTDAAIVVAGKFLYVVMSPQTML